MGRAPGARGQLRLVGLLRLGLGPVTVLSGLDRQAVHGAARADGDRAEPEAGRARVTGQPDRTFASRPIATIRPPTEVDRGSWAR